MKPVTEAWLIKAGDDYPGDIGLLPSGRPTEPDAARFEQFAEYVHTTVLSMLS